jgi:hypothetical protein
VFACLARVVFWSWLRYVLVLCGVASRFPSFGFGKSGYGYVDAAFGANRQHPKPMDQGHHQQSPLFGGLSVSRPLDMDDDDDSDDERTYMRARAAREHALANRRTFVREITSTLSRSNDLKQADGKRDGYDGDTEVRFIFRRLRSAYASCTHCKSICLIDRFGPFVAGR